MLAYIKRRKDFVTTACMEVSTWDLPLASSSDDSGTVVLAESDGRGSEGDFFYMDGHLWLIDTVTIKDGKTTLKLVGAEQVFSRTLIYNEPTRSTTIGAFLTDVLTRQFKSLSDSVYGIPYLSIINEDTTAFAVPEVDENGLFSFSDYLQTIHRLYHVRLIFTVLNDGLQVRVVKETPIQQRILFTDGSTELLKETYSKKGVAKITSIRQGTAIDWYLSDTGSITNYPPTNRAQGEWKMLVLKENDDIPTKVKEQFSKNKHSHKIEFMSDRPLRLYDTVLVRLGGKLLESYVSYIGISSDDNRYHYKSGELTTTLTETLKGVLKNEYNNSGYHLR